MTVTMVEFPKFGKIPRWYKQFTITEKIDGTNGVIGVWGPDTVPFGLSFFTQVTLENPEGEPFTRYVAAGSRTRWLTPEADNYGFSQWISRYAEQAAQLGPGIHYGEWYGSGINRGYGLINGTKRFALFNAFRWKEHRPAPFDVVPVLWSGSGDDLNLGIKLAIDSLELRGSVAAPGFMNPEGIIIYSDETKIMWKKYLVNDRNSKG